MQQKNEYSTIFDCIEFRVLQNMCSNSAFADIKHDICAGCRNPQRRKTQINVFNKNEFSYMEISEDKDKRFWLKIQFI